MSGRCVHSSLDGACHPTSLRWQLEASSHLCWVPTEGVLQHIGMGSLLRFIDVTLCLGMPVTAANAILGHHVNPIWEGMQGLPMQPGRMRLR